MCNTLKDPNYCSRWIVQWTLYFTVRSTIHWINNDYPPMTQNLFMHSHKNKVTQKKSKGTALLSMFSSQSHIEALLNRIIKRQNVLMFHSFYYFVMNCSFLWHTFFFILFNNLQEQETLYVVNFSINFQWKEFLSEI